jgi:4-amino-4-deoxy-L-arabinose transferase-like glycosyltransferase
MRKWVLPGIILLAFLLRVVALGKLPAGFTPDEASFGYDAYSLLKTGRDQWGHFFPLVLESFGDFKPPLYAYLAMPSVAIFGLTKFATRLPNALFGTVAVYIVYLLVKEILSRSDKLCLSLHFVSLQNDRKKDGNQSLITNYQSLASMSAALLAISPWHIMLSRGAFEANLTTFLLPFGVLLFLRSFRKSGAISQNFSKDSPCKARTVFNKYRSFEMGKNLVWSALIFGLNLFSYHSAKLVTPLVVLFLAFVFKKDLLKIKKKYLFRAVIIFVLFLGLTGYTITQGAARRAQDVSIINGALEEQAGDRLEAINSGLNPTTARLIHNKYRVIVRRFVNNYKQYFSFRFLFSNGPAEATYGMLPGMGVLYSIELLTLIGFFIAFVKNKTDKVFQMMVFWLIIAPIPASLTMGVGYAANRVSIMMPAIQITSAIGFVYIYELVKKKYSVRTVDWFKLVIGFVVVISFISFTKEYFIHSPNKAGQGMLYGRLEAAKWLKENVDGKNVVMSRKLSEPHIYVVFANKWDPKEYQAETKKWNYLEQNVSWVDQMPEYSLGNYTFRNIDWENESVDEAIFVGKPEEFLFIVEPKYVINYPDGNPVIYVVDATTSVYAQKN